MPSLCHIKSRQVKDLFKDFLFNFPMRGSTGKSGAIVGAGKYAAISLC
jgi:hypothetical protein